MTLNLKNYHLIVEKEKDTRNKITLRAVIPRSCVGIIIGKNGRNLQYVSNTFNVVLNLNEANDNDNIRILYITGTAENCAKAWTKYLDSCLVDFSNKIGFNFILPDGYIKYALKLYLFEAIVRDTGVNMIIKSECLPRSTDRIVNISVQDPQQLNKFYQTIKRLCTHLIKHQSIVLAYPGNQSYLKTDECKDDDFIHSMINSINPTDIVFNNKSQ